MTTPLLYLAGSNIHLWRPVAASRATALRLGVLRYMVPSITMGLAYIDDRPDASPVWYSQAGFSFCTLVALIWAIGANWLPLGSRRLTVQSTLPRKTGHSPERSSRWSPICALHRITARKPTHETAAVRRLASRVILCRKR